MGKKTKKRYRKRPVNEQTGVFTDGREEIKVKKIMRDEEGRIIPDDEELSARIIDVTDSKELSGEELKRKEEEDKFTRELADEIKEIEEEIKSQKAMMKSEKALPEGSDQYYLDEEDEAPKPAEASEPEETETYKAPERTKASDSEDTLTYKTEERTEASDSLDTVTYRAPETTETPEPSDTVTFMAPEQTEVSEPAEKEPSGYVRMADAEPAPETDEEPEETSDITWERLPERPRDNISVIPPEGNDPVEKKKIRKGPIVAAVFIVTALLAVGAGVFMALLDMGRSAGDLLSLVKGTYENEYRELALEKLRERDLGGVITLDEKDIASIADDVAEVTEEKEVVPEVQESGAQAVVIGAELLGVGNIVGALEDDETTFIKINETVSGNDVPGPDGTDPGSYVDPNQYYPLPFTAVDESYFADALFIGDSRLQGFGMYSGLVSTYYCVTSFQLYKYETMKVVQTPSGKVPIFDALEYDKYTKIYIKVGLNEMGGGTDAFLNKYAELIARLREMEPRAIIYVHAVLPVTAAKSSSDRTHNNPNIYALNEKLKAFAMEQKAYYIDINSTVSLGDGSLMPEMTSDGIHLKAGYMDIWKEYLKAHAIVIPE
ncbi:MAG: hypothetical protein K6G22_09230 [Lachnospiraceae bacterium]|nr:hypothetical protein [Lachnospiraceae bacterium]